MDTIDSGRSEGTTRRNDGPYFLPDQPEKLAAWPRPAISDADGRCTIRGVGRGLRLALVISDPRFARLIVDVETDGREEPKVVAIAVEPARVIKGRVTYAGTSEPAPHARVEVETQTDRRSAWAGDYATDLHGRYRANPGSAPHYSVTVFTPENTSYLSVTKQLEWPKGALEATEDVALPRGVRVHGKVIEEGSGKPIAGARVSYISSLAGDQSQGAANGRAATGADGSFELGVMAASGYLTVLGPGECYVLQEVDQRMAIANQPGGRRLYSHAFQRLELKPGSPSQEVAIALRPSRAVACQVVAPDGRPVDDAVVMSRVILQPTWIAWLIWRETHGGAVHDGHFSVHGLARDTEVPVYFFDRKRNLGATAMLSGKMAELDPVRVRLEPCGTARARLVDSSGEPVAGSRDGNGSHVTELVLTPGPHIMSQEKGDPREPAADLAEVTRIDPVHYAQGLASDERGELRLPALIPGARYRIYDTTMGREAGPRLRKEFTARAGETLELGDILIERAPK
jgi:hypothetical protein